MNNAFQQRKTKLMKSKPALLGEKILIFFVENEKKKSTYISPMTMWSKCVYNGNLTRTTEKLKGDGVS